MQTFICEYQYYDEKFDVLRAARVVHDDYHNSYLLYLNTSNYSFDIPARKENCTVFHDERKAVVAGLKYVFSHLYYVESHSHD